MPSIVSNNNGFEQEKMREYMEMTLLVAITSGLK